jgi:hypothetical protein
MYPNPQEALPLPSRPNREQYRKLAKDLVTSCRSGDAGAIEAWAARWIDRLAVLHGHPRTLRTSSEIRAAAERVAQFARSRFAGPPAPCSLTAAQFVLARAHGFASWPKFMTHIESLGRTESPVSAFEAAVEAVVTGNASALAHLLREHPALARARSTREHGATLLHYVSANGVEGFHQLSPSNSDGIARMLLAAGADVDATIDVYEGKCTPLGLVATSSPPFDAGVQRRVIDVLLDHGARMDRRGAVGHDAPLLLGCLANGQPHAAEHLADRGAPVDLVAAAGLGRLDRVRALVKSSGAGDAVPTRERLLEAFSFAVAYGRLDVVEFLLQSGIEVDAEIRGFGDGHTALHVAAFQGHRQLVTLLLRRGARVDAIDRTWKTPPLSWALTGWSRKPVPAHYGIVAELVAAGARVTPGVLEWDSVRADPKMMAALTGEPGVPAS